MYSRKVQQRLVKWLCAAVVLTLASVGANVLRAESEPSEAIDMAVVSGTASAERSEAVIPLLPWKGLDGMLRYRQIQNYEPGDASPSLRAISHHVLDVELTRPLTPALDLSITIENLTNRSFNETVNYSELRLAAGPGERKLIRGFTSDPLSISATITWNLGKN